jgi:acetyl-CoA carboxylase beta subunit
MRGKGVALRRLALSVLRAAVADAGGDLGVYVSRARVMEQTGITDLEEFVRVAEYLAERGFIAEGVNRYELFVVTLKGIGAGSKDQRPDL